MPKPKTKKEKRRGGRNTTLKSRVGGRRVSHPRAVRVGDKYSIGGKMYNIIEGSRAQVMNGTAHRSRGGLTKDRLTRNRQGRIVSVERQRVARKLNNLGEHKQPRGSGEFGSNKE